jgi:prolyl-tRNA editing enzyme YbaK/EbsC (Cys-tRNA(Pro) deacylase)
VRPHRGSPGVDRVAAALAAAGVATEIREYPEGARTAADAAAAVGCAVGQICKSLVFRAGDAPLLVIASGANRVDEARFGAAKADAAFVREQTG